MFYICFYQVFANSMSGWCTYIFKQSAQAIELLHEAKALRYEENQMSERSKF